MTQLQNILQMLEEETIVLNTELQSTKEEVEQLRVELNKANERLVELWQENCKQLLDHDITMVEKEREVQLLRKQLQVRELELARLKLTILREAPIQSGISEKVSQPTAAVDDYAGELSFKSTKHPLVESTITLTRGDIFTSQGISGDGIPTCLVKESDEKVTVPKITSHPSITKVTTLQVPSEQQGLMTTTTADLLTSEHVAASTSNLLKITTCL